MSSMLYGCFLCIIIPLAVMTVLLDRRSRVLILFVMIGALQFLFSQTVADVLPPVFPSAETEYLMTTYSPVIAELSKAIPVILYAFFCSSEQKTLLRLSISVGTGFAILESLYALFTADENSFFASFLLIVIYVLINTVCTSLVGIGIAYIIKSAKYFFYSALGLFAVAATLRGILNLFVAAGEYFFGALLCAVIYLSAVIIIFRRDKQKRIRLRL